MESVKFEELGIDDRIYRAITEMGFEEATPIQAQAIPLQMAGKDIIGQAQTGTGKTAAFGIPLLQQIDPADRHLQAIVLLPTRELAIQVAEEFRKLAKYMHGIKTLPIYGGQDIVRQIRGLKDGTQIVIGTPGRVMDHMRRKTIRCDQVRTVIMDEADEMLDMGFLEDMETILSEVPEERQTLMFSATMSKEIRDIAQRFLKEPEYVRVVEKELTVPKVTQYYYEVSPRTKVEVMCRLLDLYAPKLSIAFCNTKTGVDALVQELQGRGYFAEGLHGDLKQIQRDRVMDSFRNGTTEILVATDVAARGIDVGAVEAVFNYDIPQDNEYYVHRIGRTGRAGREGIAFSFVVGREVYKLRDIQRYCKTKIIPQAIPSLDDITAIKADKVMNGAAELIEQGELEAMEDIIQKKIVDMDCTAMEIAAALLRMAMGDENEDIIENCYVPRALDELDRRGGREERRGRYDRGGRDRDYGRDGRREDRRDRRREEYAERDRDKVRLFLNIGKAQGIRPGDILGAVAGESGISGKEIGSIDMYDSFTFVDVPSSAAEMIVKAMKNAKIRGKNVHAEMATSHRSES